MKISLRSIDVGFDPRATGIVCQLPFEVTEVLIDEGSIAGSLAEIKKALEKDGYKIQIDKPDFHHPELDGKWNRVLPNGILECRDPNSGIGWDDSDKPRHQWMVRAGMVWRRILPAISAGVGDTWRDAPSREFPVPWHAEELQTPRSWPLICRYIEWAIDRTKVGAWEAPTPMILRGDDFRPEIILVERTENGRDIRYIVAEKTYEVQPHNDNYWCRVPTLRQAREKAKKSKKRC